MEPHEPVADTPPPPPPAPVAARTTMTTIPTAGRVLKACLAPLLSYVIAVGASLVLMGLVIVAIAVQDGASGETDPTAEIDIEAIGTLIGMPFQLAGMALGGSLGLGDSDFSLSLFAPPLLLTAVFVFAVYRLSKADERATPSAGPTERMILAVSGAVATAVIAMLLTRLLAMRADGVAMHSATFGLFFGVLLLAGVAAMLGRQAAVDSLWPRGLPADGRRAAQIVAQHLLLWMVILVPVAMIWLFVEGGVEAALYGLVWAATVGLGAFAMGHLGAVATFGEQQFAWDLGWFPGVILPILAVTLAVVVAVAWHLRRGQSVELLVHPASWVSLPVAYGVTALVVCLLSTVRLSGEFFGVGGGVSMHGAYWLIPVLAFWGAAIEVLSRFVAPAIAGALPRSVTRFLAKGPAELVAPPLAPTQRIPMSPADRARAKKALIGLGVVAGLGLVGVVAVSIIGATAYNPEDRAEAYLDAVVDADVEKALDLAPVDDDEASDVLLTNGVYEETEDRITGYEITDVDDDGGDTVTVTVDLKGPEDGDDVELTLEADGRRGLFFRDWKVADGGLVREVTVSVPESSSALEVNGTSIPANGGEDVDLWALPGSYAFNPYGDSKWLEPGDSQTSVPAADSFGVYAEIDDPQPSDELKEYVDSSIAEWVNGCMTATELDPPDCPQDAFGSGDKQRNVSWKLVSMPTVSWDGFYGTFPADLSSDTSGEATATYEYDASYGFGAPDWTQETEDSDLYVNAKVDLIDDEPQVTFDSY